jgi:hypothetical protein
MKRCSLYKHDHIRTLVGKMNVGEVSIYARQHSIAALGFGTEVFIVVLSFQVKYHEIHLRLSSVLKEN